MKTKKKLVSIKTISLLLGGLLLLLAGMLLFPACGFKESRTKHIERICNIELPKEIEIEYDFYSQAFHGDFTLFTVFKLKEKPTKFLKDNSFSIGKTEVSFEYILLLEYKNGKTKRRHKT